MSGLPDPAGDARRLLEAQDAGYARCAELLTAVDELARLKDPVPLTPLLDELDGLVADLTRRSREISRVRDELEAGVLRGPAADRLRASFDATLARGRRVHQELARLAGELVMAQHRIAGELRAVEAERARRATGYGPAGAPGGPPTILDVPG